MKFSAHAHTWAYGFWLITQSFFFQLIKSSSLYNFIYEFRIRRPPGFWTSSGCLVILGLGASLSTKKLKGMSWKHFSVPTPQEMFLNNKHSEIYGWQVLEVTITFLFNSGTKWYMLICITSWFKKKGDSLVSEVAEPNVTHNNS